MADYLDTLLASGETVTVQARQANEFKKAVMTGQDQIQRDRAGITADAIQQALGQGAAPASSAATAATQG